MGYRLLLDENVEHDLYHRLEHDGHDVEHVDFVSELGKGSGDYSVARYGRETGRVIVTYDDDFVLEVDETEHDGALYINDATLSVTDIAEIIHTVAHHYPQYEIDGIEYLDDQWL